MLRDDGQADALEMGVWGFSRSEVPREVAGFTTKRAKFMGFFFAFFAGQAIRSNLPYIN